MAPRRRAKSIALLIGVAIAVVPLIGLNLLLWFHINTSGNAQIQDAGQAILRQVEDRIDSAMTALIQLGLRDVKSCSGEARDSMMQAIMTAPFASEFAVVDQKGHVICSGLGRGRVVREISATHDTLHPSIVIDVVDHGVSSGPRVLRLTWTYEDGMQIRALIAGADLIPPVLVGRLQSDFAARLSLVDGTFITGRLTRDNLAIGTDSVDIFESFTTSMRYPMTVRISVPNTALWQTYQDFFIYGNTGGLVMGAIVIFGAWVAARRFDGPERELADALRKGQFIPYYQPVIDLRTGRLIGCEALVRWRKPNGSIIPPSQFITIAEMSGQIFDITRAVMRKGLEDLEEAYASRPHLKVSYNLVAGHFDTLEIVQDVRNIYENSRMSMKQITFEVTERQQLPNMTRARIVISRLQELGAQVAIDDVGTGHGGLSYLLKLGVDQMKIDKMFIDAIGTDRYSTAIIDSLVRLADEMSMDLVAEGVETLEQVEYLRDKGVYAAQGYIFSPPLPAKSYLALVEAIGQPAHEHSFPVVSEEATQAA